MAFTKTRSRWYNTRPSLVVFGLIKLGLSYLLVSLAINSGSLWEYALAIFFLIAGLSDLIRSLKASKK